MSLVVSDSDAVRTLRIDRPAAMNAVDRPTLDLLSEAARDAADDPAVRCVLLTGTGERAFCVGADLNEYLQAQGSGDFDVPALLRTGFNPLALRLATMPKPLVVGLNGTAAGAGMSLALAGDVRVMSSSAALNTAFAAIGLGLDSGLSWWLPRIVGVARAKDLALRPRSVPAEECLALGLVDEVVPADQVPARAAEVAAGLAAGPTLAYAAVRRALVEHLAMPLEQALDSEAAMMAGPSTSADNAEAVHAFLDKRRPEFHGR